MKLRLTFLGITISLLGFAQSNEWQNPKINQVNRQPIHTSFFAYENTETAKGCKTDSENYFSLNGTWKFNWVKDSNLRPTNFFRIDFDDKSWDDMSVPGIWEMNGYGDPVYVNIGYPWENQTPLNPTVVPEENNHVGSYRRTIDLPVGWKGKQIIAHFGAVTSNLYLWVNGKFVGYSEDSKLEAEFDITKYLQAGKNLIAFQVFRWCDGSFLEDQDMWRLSGVSRDCYLYTRNAAVQLQDIRITPDLDSDYKNGSLDVELTVKGKAAILLELKDKAQKTVASSTVSGSGKINTRFNIENPEKWTAETPDLYTLTATVKSDNKILEVVPQKVGFRKIEIKNAQLLVNDQPVLIKGVNRHEMDPDNGSYISTERMLQDIRIMKELNINAVRTCHYPDNSLWYDLCDQYGIYMVAEADVESHGMGYEEKTLAKNTLYDLAHLERNQRNVQRNYNHPAIIVWSMGNEAGFGPNFEACYRWIKNKDKSRPVQYEQAHGNDFTDIYCPMYLDYNDCEKYCQSDKDKPLIQCEYSHAMGNSAGGFKEYWDLVRKYPKYQGGFIWDFVDQSLHKKNKDGIEIYAYGGDYNPYDPSDNNYVNNGLISPDRKQNPHAHEVKYFYQNIWAESIEGKTDEISIYNENFFRNLSAYYLEWQLLVNGEAQQTGRIDNLDVAPQQKQNYQLGFDISDIPAKKEILLNISFKLKNKEGLLTAGYEVAYCQLLRQPYPFGIVCEHPVSVNNKPSVPVIKDNDRNFLQIYGDNFEVEFDRHDGWLSKLVYNGQNMLNDGTKLTPNFWRAPTDNDMGANLQFKYAAWRNPEIKLNSLNTKVEDSIIIVEANYDMNNVSAKLQMTYKISACGTLAVTEKLIASDAANVSEMFRFGMQMQLAEGFDFVEYYGRGPFENYADRNSSSNIGLYRQTVDEQYYPYVRPQETGTKTDIRYWKMLNRAGKGIEFTSGMPYSASALHYSLATLDEGMVKKQRHSSEIFPTKYTNFCIDKVQMGLGCLNSWGGIPLPQYRIPYKDYEFNFNITPVK